LLGDHGSGMSLSCLHSWLLLIRVAYHLGVTAARIAADDYSMRRRTDTPLYRQLCAHYGVDSPGDLPARIVRPQTPQERVSELFRIPQHQLDPTLDAISSSNARKLLIADSSALVLASITPLSTSPQSTSDPFGLRIVQSCVDTLAADIHDVIVAFSEQTDGGFQASEATLAMTGGIVARPVFREMLEDALRKRGVIFAGTTCVANAGDHGAVGLSRAFARAQGRHE
jgi:hypothetical protein